MIPVNINEHPTNRNKKVFYFKVHQHANYFENLLIEEKIVYEKQLDEEGDQTIYYGVRIADFEHAKRLNYLTIGKFRKPFIPDRSFRIILFLVSIIILGMAIAGAIISNS
jgi:hypothetical protein